MTSLFSGKHKSRSTGLLLETLESRLVPANAAFDIIGLTALRANPATQGFTGAGISVAVIDTGVDYTHTLLSGGLVKTSDNEGGKNVGRDFIGDSEAGAIDGGYLDSTEDNVPEDINGHGTHVAGIIAARNTDIGVAQGAGIIGLKVIGSDNTGSNEDILSALRWVRDNADIYNIRVVNMSLGFGFFTALNRETDPFRIAIEDLEDRGVTVVSAAGNDYGALDPERNSGTPGIGSTLNVGATWKDGTYSDVRWSDSTDFTTGPRRLTSFSQRPPAGAGTLNNEIFAPGAIITSTIPNNGLDPSAPNNLTGDLGGTSQAAPMVAGMVAIMQNASMSLGGRYLTPAEVRQILVSTAQTINDGDDEDDSVVNTNANYHFARIDLAVAQIQTLFNTPGVNDDPNGTMASAQRFFYDFNDPIRISGNLGNDGGYDTERMNGADLPGVFDATFFSGSGNVLVGRKDVDFYSVNFNQPGTMFVRTSDITNSSPTTINTAVRVFNSSGVQIAVNDDFDPFTPNTNDTLYQPFSRLSIAINTPGTYFVAVSGGGNITYNPNVELSGTDAIDSTRPPQGRLSARAITVSRSHSRWSIRTGFWPTRWNLPWRSGVPWHAEGSWVATTCQTPLVMISPGPTNWSFSITLKYAKALWLTPTPLAPRSRGQLRIRMATTTRKSGSARIPMEPWPPSPRASKMSTCSSPPPPKMATSRWTSTRSAIRMCVLRTATSAP